MKNLAIAAAVVSGLALSAGAGAQQPKGVIAVEQTEAVVTVTKVDRKARTVTVRGPKGGIATLDVPAESKNLDQVKAGSQFKVRYVEAVGVSLSAGGHPSVATSQTVQLAPKGANPGGVAVRTSEVSGVIVAIDYAHRDVAVAGPKGNVLAFKVADEVQNLDQVGVGDKITVSVTQAFAMEMIPQPKKTKPAAKNSK